MSQMTQNGGPFPTRRRRGTSDVLAGRIAFSDNKLMATDNRFVVSFNFVLYTGERLGTPEANTSTGGGLLFPYPPRVRRSELE